MKRALLILFTGLLAGSLFAQVPPGINYQAIARDAGDAIIVSTDITVEITILSDLLPEYSETHMLTTSPFGVFQLVIGQGVPVSGTFGAIDWSSGVKEVQTRIDFGSGYVDMGTTQMWSVPFAQYAAESPGGGGHWTENAGDVHRETGDVGIGNDFPTNKLDVRPSETNSYAGIDLVNEDPTGDIGIFMGTDGGYDYGIGIDNSAEQRFEIVRGSTMNSTPVMVFEREEFIFDGNTEYFDQCGIYNDDPQAALDVGGEIRASNLAGPNEARLKATADGTIIRSGPETDHLFLSGADFYGNNIVYETFGLTCRGSAGTNDFLYCPIHLPDGAEIQGMEFYATDSHSTKTLRVEVQEYQIELVDTYGPFEILFGSTMGSAGRFSYVDPTAVNGTIDNSTGHYVCVVYVIGGDFNWNSSDLLLHGVRIDYTK